MEKKSIIFDFLIFILLIYLFVYFFNDYKNTEKFSDIIKNLESKINTVTTTAKKGDFCSDYRIKTKENCKVTGFCLEDLDKSKSNCTTNKWKGTTYWGKDSTKFQIFKNKLDILNKLATCDNCAPSKSDINVEAKKNTIKTKIDLLEDQVDTYLKDSTTLAQYILNKK